MKVKSANKWQILKDAPFLQGGLNLATSIAVDQGTITIEGGMTCDHLNVESPDFVVQRLRGNIPLSIVLESFNHPDNMSIAHNIRLGGGTLYLHTAPAGVEQNSTRKVYYEDLRPYRQEAGLRLVTLNLVTTNSTMCCSMQPFKTEPSAPIISVQNYWVVISSAT